MSKDNRSALFTQFKYDAITLIETGTQSGDGVQGALDAGFARIISFEKSMKTAAETMSRFHGFPQVTIFAEGSLDGIFASMIRQTNNRVVYWLDAHLMAGNGKGWKDYPLGGEVQAICRNVPEGVPAPIVLCDDRRLFDRYSITEGAIRGALEVRFGRYRASYGTSKTTLPGDVLALIPEELI